MISCKSVAEILNGDQLASLSWRRRLEVRLHLMMCDFCSRLARQLEQMRHGAQQMRKQVEPDEGLEERVIRRLSGR